MADAFALEGPVENMNGTLTMSIPLKEGGDKFVHCTRGIAHIDLERECLNIVLPKWLIEKLGISEGTRVVVSNEDGKFHCWLADAQGNSE